MILAGDIGGTKTNLAVFEQAGEGLEPLVEAKYASREFNGLDEIVRDFAREHRFEVAYACFGIAGAVRNGVCETPNLAWTVDARRLASALDLPGVELINDVEANAYGIDALDERDFAVLNQGDPDATGNAAVIAAGTGLGQAVLYWDGVRRRPFATEGGHVDFAPRNRLESDLLEYLRPQFGRVSYERVLSGPGLSNIYSFLRDTGRGEEPVWLAEELWGPDLSAVISGAAEDGRSDLCRQALDLFCSLYGSEAGNLALKSMATGGVFLGGGIAPKIIGKLKEPIFMEAFTAKGRLRSLLEAMPVRVILNDRAALLGAARRASLSLPRELV